MSTDENKAIIRRWFDEVINHKRIDRADLFVASDYVDHGALPGQAPGLEGAKQKWAMYIAAVPDLRGTVDDMVAEGDKVAARWTPRGRSRGSFWASRRPGSTSGSAASASAAWLRGRWGSSSSSGIGWT